MIDVLPYNDIMLVMVQAAVLSQNKTTFILFCGIIAVLTVFIVILFELLNKMSFVITIIKSETIQYCV